MTKPTNTPIDTTRRHLLTMVAGGAVAAAIPADARAYPGHAADPIFAAIEAHRKAATVEEAAWDEVDRLHELADERVGPLEIEIPSMIEPGTTVLASDWGHIEATIPRSEYPDLFEHYVALLEDRKAARAAIIGAENGPAVVPYVEAWAAREKFAETIPTTLPGLRAMIVYADELEDEDPEAFWNPGDRRLLETLATAAQTLMRVQS
jgi:hypothetical protein